MTQRVVISECFGGFGLSEVAQKAMRDKGWQGEYVRDVARNDPILLAVLDELGTETCSDRFSALAVVELPDDVKWHIHEYDGFETVHEDHRTWTSEGMDSAPC